MRAAGVQSAAGFNYRNVPAVELARQLIADGRIGAVDLRQRFGCLPTTPRIPKAR